MGGTALRQHFDDLGYVRLRGLLAGDIERIQADFERIVGREPLGVVDCRKFMDGSPNGCDTRTRLLSPEPLGPGRALHWLLDDPRLTAVVAELLGPDAEYYASQANIYNCNVHWHTDTIFTGGRGRHLSVMVYLDPLDGSDGALRVIPGSHRAGRLRDRLLREIDRSAVPLRQVFGVPADQLPSHVVDVQPGDVVLVDLDVAHASFHGGTGRRLLSLTYGPPLDPERRAEALQVLALAAAAP